MTPCVIPKFPFSERTCSRDDEVSFGIGSSHPTDCSWFASVVHNSWNVKSGRCLEFSSHQKDFLCVCVLTCLRICIHLELWIVYIWEHAKNTWISSPANFLSWSSIQSTVRLPWLTFTIFGVASALPSSPPFSHLENFGAVNVSENAKEVVPPFALLVRVMLECACSSEWTLSFCDPTDCSLLCRSSCWHFFAFFFFALPLLAKYEPLIFLHQSVFGPPTSICNNHTSGSRLSSLERFNSFDFSTCILNRLSYMLSVGVSVTAENTSSHFVSKKPERCRSLNDLPIHRSSPRWLECRHLLWRCRRSPSAMCLPANILFSDWALPSASVTCFF